MIRNTNAYAAMIIAMTLVGSSLIVGKWVTNAIPVFLASFLRFGIASALLLLLLYLKEGFPKLERNACILLFLQSLTGVVLFNVCVLYGLQMTTVVEGGIITSTSPLVISLLSFLLFKERISIRQWLGVVMAVFGIAAIHLFDSAIADGGISGGGFPWLGNALLMCAVVGESLFTLIGKRLSRQLSPLAITTFVSVWGFVLFMPLAAYEAVTFDFSQPSSSDWLWVVYLAIIVTVVGFMLWYYGVSIVSTGTSAAFTGIIAVSSLMFSYWLLEEPIRLGHGVGMALVVAAILYSARAEQRSSSMDPGSSVSN
ncbi:DMT family transporter [Paenibacillus sp. sptzw28]|uniref:DMT family transporter n=1 Tax=Paenibacillus sp. sptzw28 TaxID=715179 RepID=UPI001C6F5B37|nr:DMT family transporter [Paenibacillus sp. sptzw28]QYR23492.1 DMT family transporter [Paenibacillus sp. sptzw28]